MCCLDVEDPRLRENVGLHERQPRCTGRDHPAGGSNGLRELEPTSKGLRKAPAKWDHPAGSSEGQQELEPTSKGLRKVPVEWDHPAGNSDGHRELEPTSKGLRGSPAIGITQQGVHTVPGVSSGYNQRCWSLQSRLSSRSMFGVSPGLVTQSCGRDDSLSVSGSFSRPNVWIVFGLQATIPNSVSAVWFRVGGLVLTTL